MFHFVILSVFSIIPQIKQQVLLCDAESKMPKDFRNGTLFWINQKFCLM